MGIRSRDLKIPKRYKSDAVVELMAVETKIRTKRRTLTPLTIERLEERAAELRYEVANLPERPERYQGTTSTGPTTFSRNIVTEPYTKQELKDLEIPAFLRRTPLRKLPIVQKPARKPK